MHLIILRGLFYCKHIQFIIEKIIVFDFELVSNKAITNWGKKI